MNELQVKANQGVYTKVEGFIHELYSSRKDLPSIPTEDLAVAFVKLKPCEKELKKFDDAVRKELLDNRLDDVKDTETEKGHRYFDTPTDYRVKAEKRTKLVLNKKLAKQKLEEMGMYGKVIEEKLVVLDPQKLVTLSKQLVEFQKEGILLSDEEVEEIDKDVESCYSTEEVINEEKLEALVTIGDIDIEEVTKWYVDKGTYAFKVEKKKRE